MATTSAALLASTANAVQMPLQIVTRQEPDGQIDLSPLGRLGNQQDTMVTTQRLIGRGCAVDGHRAASEKEFHRMRCQWRP